MACTPGTLLESSKCFLCFSEHQNSAIEAYLLAQIAGVTPDLTLLAAAKCFVCLDEKQNNAIEAHQLCQINGG
jgi:hypothetical protein